MKQLITAGLLSVAVLATVGGTADAGLFRCCRHCSKYSTYICVRPYNAFSPVCFGSVTGIGCMPFFGGGPGFGWPGAAPFMPSVFSHGPECCDAGFGHHGYIPGHAHDAPAGEPGKQMPPAGKPFVPPNPTPVPGNTLVPPQNLSYYYSPVHQAAYQPAHPMGYYGYQQPGYHPTYNLGYYHPGYYPMTQGYAVPSYWYGMQP
jgi:hypothetical protein